MLPNLSNDSLSLGDQLGRGRRKKRVEVHGHFPVLAQGFLEELSKRWVIRYGCATAMWGTVSALLLRGGSHHRDRFGAFFERMRLAALSYGLGKPLEIGGV